MPWTSKSITFFTQLKTYSLDVDSREYFNPVSLMAKQFFLMRLLGFEADQDTDDCQGFSPTYISTPEGREYFALDQAQLLEAINRWSRNTGTRLGFSRSGNVLNFRVRLIRKSWWGHLFLGRMTFTQDTTISDVGETAVTEITLALIELFAQAETQAVVIPRLR